MTVSILNEEDALQAFGGQRFRDWYWSPNYAPLARSHDGGEWRVAVSDCAHRFWYPFVVRDIPAVSLQDVITPYGYGGIEALGEPADQAALAAFRTDLDAVFAGQGVVSEFCRLHPVFDATRTQTALVNSSTYSIDLSVDDEERLAGVSGRHRTAVRRARKDLVKVRNGEVDSLRSSEGEFRSLYSATMQRVGATSSYLYSDAYYESMVAGFHDSLILIETHNADGIVSAAAIFVVSGALAQYHLSCADRSVASPGTTNLLIEEAIPMLRSHGARRLHLGGGRAAGDGLDTFKGSMATDTHEFCLDRRVHNVDAYDELSAAEATAGSPDFFPLYRAPRDGS